MGGADRERAAILVAVLVRDALDVLDFAQHANGAIDNLLACGSDLGQGASAAHENAKAQLVFQQLDLLAHRRLRGVQFLRGGGDVEAVLDDGREVAQLLEFHERGARRICPF